MQVSLQVWPRIWKKMYDGLCWPAGRWCVVVNWTADSLIIMHGQVMFCMHVVFCCVCLIGNTFFWMGLCVDSYPKMNCEINVLLATENPHFWSGTVATWTWLRVLQVMVCALILTLKWTAYINVQYLLQKTHIFGLVLLQPGRDPKMNCENNV